VAERIVFDGKQQVRLESFDLPPVRPGEVRVRARVSLMSTGTENIAFNELFSAGTHWAAWVRYPFHPGYAAVGDVEAVGPGVDHLAPGNTVFVGMPHASHFVVPAATCATVPSAVDVRDAVWQALAGTAFVGARAASYRLGSAVVIVGAGPIGQMSTRWAAAAGADRIVVVDTFPSRLELARAGGATAVIDGPIVDRRDDIIAAVGGQQPPIVIDCTGDANVLAGALDLVGFRGRVVVLGDTGSPEDQHLTSDLITRGITIVGAHAGHLATVLDDDVDADPFAVFRPKAAPAAAPEPTGQRFARLFHRLVATGRFPLDGLISHEFAAGDCEQAYKLANTARDTTMGILFDWT